jgi:hypothetical protein
MSDSSATSRALSTTASLGGGGDAGTKVFTVTGDAAAAIGTRKRRKRTTAKTETVKMDREPAPQAGGTSPGTLVQIQANKAPNAAPAPPANFKNSTETALAKTTTESSPAPVASGGGKDVKVILEKKKKATRVVLAPTKVKKIPGSITLAPAPSKTRKVAKKIRMSLNGFGKRVTRANTIRQEAKKHTVDDVKRTLVEAKLIKADSKAPEGVLRQMYSDYMMLKNRAL